MNLITDASEHRACKLKYSLIVLFLCWVSNSEYLVNSGISGILPKGFQVFDK